jgi:fermentation-respiration switch protein FrsA (DUF1100 family)
MRHGATSTAIRLAVLSPSISLRRSRIAPSARGLIVESSFTSLPDVISDSGYGWLPLQLLLSQKFDSVGKIQQIRMPVLIVHGEEDRYVPARLSSALYAAAPQPKRLLLIPNGTHNNGVFTGDADYRRALQELFGPLAPAPKDNAQKADMLRRTSTGSVVNRREGHSVLDQRSGEVESVRD